MIDENDYLHADKYERFLQIDAMICDSVPKFEGLEGLYNTSKRDFRDEVDFLHVDTHQSFPQVDFSTLDINISCKVTLSLLMKGMIKHSKSTQSNKFTISLQYLKKEVRHRIHFLHTD